MELLDFGGRLCLALNYENGCSSELAKVLLPHIKAQASKTKKGSSLALYWNHRITSWLDERIYLELDGTPYLGTLMGASTLSSPEGPPLPLDTYRIRLSGSQELELVLDLKKLGNGSARICRLG